MASSLAATFGAAIIGTVLLTVLGAVTRTERFVFVAGVVLLVAGPALAGSIPSAVGRAVALLGFLAVLASTVPLLRQSPTTS